MKKTIQVCGDPTLDWLWFKNSEKIEHSGTFYWQSPKAIPKISLGSQGGGSLLMFSLINKMCDQNAVTVVGEDIDDELLNKPNSKKITECWTVWQAYIDKDRKKDDFSYRICEWPGFEPGSWDYEKQKLTGKADLLLIEDSGVGFRKTEGAWPETIKKEGMEPEFILYKMAKCGDSGAKNPLINHIKNKKLNERTVLITSLQDLRSCPVRIGSSLSWEKLFDEIVDAVYGLNIFYDSGAKKLLFGKIIVTVGTAGAVIISAKDNELIFDRSGQEDDFSRLHKGELLGYNTCLMGAIAKRWSEQGAGMDWTEAVREGIALARFLNVKGYEEQKKDNYSTLQFPFKSVIETLENKPKDNSSDPDNIWNLGVYSAGEGGPHIEEEGEEEFEKSNKDNWSILERVVNNDCGGSTSKNSTKAVCKCAIDIVKKGPRKALVNVPVEIAGDWISADRHEIEGIRSVGNAVRNYLSDIDVQKAPLCIAVFGPPGSGKSFAIQEIVKGLDISKDSQITFNLSQFRTYEELTAAFHQARDIQLKGKIPLIFWDEFDSRFNDKPLGWLKFFLAPMHDGEFIENGRVHPIGKGIFVFAGATRYSFEKFCVINGDDDLSAKKPDFISRLKAYIDIKGPNGNPDTIRDNLFIIRRAILLNHLLGKFAPSINEEGCFQIEENVLNAFLRSGQYKYGARSMETLIKMSNVKGKRKYEYSCLPPDQVTGMHVNTDEFISLAQLGHKEMMRIGITGHIALNKDHIDIIKNTVNKAIDFIEEKYHERYLTVFSPLALGSDRLVARLLLKKKGSLIAVLPVQKDDYINDFGKTDLHSEAYDDAEMRQEFRYWIDNKTVEVIELPQTPTRNDAYLQMGYFIARNCDLLIAVWDGQNAAGKGGTGDIVKEAERLNKPIVHVWAENNKESCKTDLGSKIGTFRYKNIQGTEDDWDK